MALEEQMDEKKYDYKEHVCFSCGGLLKVSCSEKQMTEAPQLTFKGCEIVIFQVLFVPACFNESLKPALTKCNISISNSRWSWTEGSIFGVHESHLCAKIRH